MLYPVIPTSSLKVLNVFNISENNVSFESIKKHKILIYDTKINKIDILFAKIEKND